MQPVQPVKHAQPTLEESAKPVTEDVYLEREPTPSQERHTCSSPANLDTQDNILNVNHDGTRSSPPYGTLSQPASEASSGWNGCFDYEAYQLDGLLVPDGFEDIAEGRSRMRPLVPQLNSIFPRCRRP